MRHVGLLVSSLLAGAVGAAPWVLTDVAHGFAYQDEAFGSVVIEGVCALSSDSVTCWKPDGARDSALEKRADQLMSNSGALPVAYHKRNLFLMIRESSRSTHLFTAYYRGDRGLNASSRLTQVLFDNAPTSFLVMAAMPVDQGLGALDVVAALQVPLPPITVKYGRKQRVALGSYTLEIGSPIRTSAAMQATSYGAWALPYKVAPPPGEDALTVNAVLIGRDGKPLRLKGAPKLPPLFNGLARVGSYEANRVRDSAGERWLFSCDPKEIAAVRLEPYYRRLVTFKNVALEPKG